MRYILLKLGLGELRNDASVRALSLATLLGRIGNGLVSTIEVIYFTLIVGLSPVGVATALGVGGVASLLATVPAGNIVDRFGAKRVMIIAAVLEGLSILSLVFVQTVFWLSVAVAVISIIGTTFHVANTTVISQIGIGEDRIKIRAAERAMANMGIGLGTVFAGFALAINTLWAYQAMIFLNCVFYIWAAAILNRVPNVEATVSKDEKIGIIALKDKRFLAATFLNGIVSLHFLIQGVALPLWIIQYTDAPKWWVSVLFVINTVLVTVLQIRFSSGTGDMNVSIKKFRVGTLWLLGACVIYSVSGGVPAGVTCVVLAVGMLVHTIGELQAAAGSWSIGFDLAEEKHMGQYQAVYSLGWGLGGTFGPLYVTAMAIGLGMTGWWVMGGIFAAAGLGMFWLVEKTYIAKQPIAN